MSKFKRILTVGITAVMLLAVLSVSAFAATTKFTDVNAKDETLSKAVSLLEGLGVAKGTTETTFGTNENVTRQQMAAFIYRLMKKGSTLEGGDNNTPFEDLYDDTYYGMVSWANAMGIIKGVSATEFDPDGSIILQDAYTMLVRALDYEKNTQLGYPFDFIEIAESSGVNLDEGLPSSVNYDTELTRGNVAILLYNAFYAETGIAETVERERLIGEGENAKYVLETVEEYPRLCEKVYDVIEEEFVVRETTHYAFNDSKNSTAYKATEDSAGEGTMLLVAAEDNQEVASFYTTAEALGLEDSADNYIMSHVTVFYTLDEDEEAVEEILFAEPLIQKASAESATHGSVTADRVKGDAEHFYSPSDANYPRMDGSMTVAGKVLYFYDAPYTYAEPSYNGCETDEDRYAVRNADNTLLIDLTCTDVDKGLYSYYIRDERFGSKDGYDTELDKAFATFFHQVRTSGIYAMDIYDPDGDGRYEYMWYKPATFGKVNIDDDYDFVDFDEYKENKPVSETPKKIVENGLSTVPVIYTNGATIDGTSGVTYRDGDFVIAYLNGDANYMYIFGTAQGKQGTITYYNSPTGTVRIGNQEFRTCYQFRFLENYFQYDNISVTATSGSANTNVFPFLVSSNSLDTEVILYTYNKNYNNVVYYEIVSAAASQYSGENILIPLSDETIRSQNAETFKFDQYLKVWVDGEEKYVLVDVENCYPELKETIDGTYKFDQTVVEDDGNTYYAYLNKVCTYSVDSEGYYTIHSILHGRDEDGRADHIDLVFDPSDFFDEKTVNQAGMDLGSVGANEEARLKKVTSTRYQLIDKNGYSMLGTYGESKEEEHWFNDATVDAGTTIIIRSVTLDEDGEQENEFTVYKGNEFPGTTESMLTNIQYVYENIEDNSTRVRLVLLYGEVDGDFEFSSASSNADLRIVKSSSPNKVDEKEFRYSYTLFNLTTGEVEEGVYGTMSKASASSLSSEEPLAAGSIVKMDSAGYVDDKEAPEGILDPVTNENLAFLLDVDAVGFGIELAPVNPGDDDYFTVDGKLHTFYEVDEDVKISVVKFTEQGDYDTAEVSLLTLEELAKAGKDIKSYNTKVPDKDGNFNTEYSEYVKAYVTYSKKSNDEYPVIDSIIVVVNPDEPVEYLED